MGVFQQIDDGPLDRNQLYSTMPSVYRIIQKVNIDFNEFSSFRDELHRANCMYKYVRHSIILYIEQNRINTKYITKKSDITTYLFQNVSSNKNIIQIDKPFFYVVPIQHFFSLHSYHIIQYFFSSTAYRVKRWIRSNQD